MTNNSPNGEDEKKDMVQRLSDCRRTIRCTVVWTNLTDECFGELLCTSEETEEEGDEYSD